MPRKVMVCGLRVVLSVCEKPNGGEVLTNTTRPLRGTSLADVENFSAEGVPEFAPMGGFFADAKFTRGIFRARGRFPGFRRWWAHEGRGSVKKENGKGVTFPRLCTYHVLFKFGTLADVNRQMLNPCFSCLATCTSGSRQRFTSHLHSGAPGALDSPLRRPRDQNLTQPGSDGNDFFTGHRRGLRRGVRVAWLSGLTCLFFATFLSFCVLLFLVYREQVALQKATLAILQKEVESDIGPRQTIVYYRTNETLHSVLSAAARPKSAAVSEEDLTEEEETFAISTEAAFFSGFTVAPLGCAPPMERVRLQMYVFFSRPETVFLENEHYLIEPRGLLTENATTG